MISVQVKGGLFSGVITPPTTDPFRKLYEAKEKGVPTVYLIKRSGKKILVKTGRLLFDSLDQDLKGVKLIKRFWFFGEIIEKRFLLHYTDLKDVEFVQ